MSFAREAWKRIDLGQGFTNNIILEVSDFGRIRTYNKINKGKLMKGSMINGYRIIRLKLFRQRDEEVTRELKTMQEQLAGQVKKIKTIQKTLNDKAIGFAERRSLTEQLETETRKHKKDKSHYTLTYNNDAKKRTFYYAALVHRLVAEHFLPEPLPGQTMVTHLDHDKLNNMVNNLKWMSEQEKTVLQKSSPLVIAEKMKKKQGIIPTASNHKLTVTKVMFLKKLLNEGKPVRNLAKQFKVTETQIMKIKNQVNWGTIEAAK